ncbi:MAG TPA: BatA domain-containing protein [Bacteroidota bacterium]|nr:BatA domain-containing protein [Bacteroidota bacterium]
MTFLNPFVLFGLAAAAIPVVLHLLNLRKLRTVEFSSVRFLKELQKTSLRRLRIRQILLLVVRTLLIISVVLAFSRPALRVRFGGFGSPAASSTMIIIIDDSPSMNVRDERGTSFARALQAASGLVDIAAEGDRLYVIPLSELRPGNPLPAPRTPESAREALRRMTPSPMSIPLGDALRSIRPLLAGSPDANREVIFAGDGQATQLLPAATVPDSAGVLDPRAGLFLCASPPLRHDNRGVTGGEVLTRIVSEKRPVRFRARISNTGDQQVRESVVSLYADGARVAQQSLDIPPRGEVRPVFTFGLKRRGILGCSVQTEDDGFESDNTFAFVVEVPEHIAVLLTGPDPSSTRLVSLALTLGGDSLLAGHLSATQTTNDFLPSVDFARFDVIVMCGFEGLNPSAARNVAQFVRDGGGLVAFPHPSADSADVTLFRELALPLPSGPPVSAPAGSFVSFSSIDYAHPLFEGLFDAGGGPRKGEPSVESPVIQRSLMLSAGEKGARVIGLTNGHAFLVDQGVGAGRVLVFAVDAGTAWSDFPLKGLFAPLLHRGIAYTGSRASPQRSLAPGDPLEFSVRLRSFTNRDTYTITSPDGRTTKVVPAFSPGTGTARFSGGTALEPGVYRLSRDGRGAGEQGSDIAALAVNIPPRESDLRSASEEEIGAFGAAEGMKPAQVHTMAPERAAETVRESRYGVEVWKDFVWLAVLLAVAEMALGRAGGTAAAEAEVR